MNSIIERILKFALRWRTTLLTAHYAVAALLSLGLAYQIRFDFQMDRAYELQYYQALLWIVPLKVGMLTFFGQFHSLLSYFSIPDLKRTVYACFSASAVILIHRIAFTGGGAPPRGVILADLVLFVTVIAGGRLLIRLYREKYVAANGRHRSNQKRVGIIGAGDVGASLARELMTKPGFGLVPVAFFDDNPALWNSRVHNLPVAGRPELLTQERLRIQLDEVIIAMPGASAQRLREVIHLLHQAHLHFETVPSLQQLATGAVKVSQLRAVEIQDLLGRDGVQLESDAVQQFIAGRKVLVTGAGGSIGSELCRQISTFCPQQLILVEQCEVLLFQVEQELIELGAERIVVPLVGDVLDEERMRSIFERFKPEIVFHAAAHKHVPMMENQPSEAIKNNAFGTAVLARTSRDFDVAVFVLISTDKAINPTSVMGATKRMAEQFMQALHAANPGVTRFVAVRFGNVLGSSGSVIPIFRKQIEMGGPVKVTHPDVTRYFMTIPEAVGLVLQSSTLATGGEIFVLDMGQAIKIADLARQMIELSGLRPGEDISIEFTGLRPGEKLYEELQHTNENHVTTSHPKIMRFVGKAPILEEIQAKFAGLGISLVQANAVELKRMIKAIVPEYQPYEDTQLPPEQLRNVQSPVSLREPKEEPVGVSP